MFKRELLDVQNIDKSGHIEYLHDIGLDVCDRHLALLVHHFLRGKKHAKTGGRYVVESRKVEHEFRDVVHRVAKLGLELRGRRCVEPSLKSDSQFAAFKIFVDRHFCFPLHYSSDQFINVLYRSLFTSNICGSIFIFDAFNIFFT